MLEQLEAMYQEAAAELNAVTTSDALREWELKTLGKNGAVTDRSFYYP